MKIKSVKLHNFRSFLDAYFELGDYSLLVGANNAGKSNIIHSLLVFYEKTPLSSDDFPKLKADDPESWIEICYGLSEEEWKNIKDTYKREDKLLNIRKYLRSEQKEVKAKQSNLYAVINGEVENNLFYGARNIGQDKLGDVIYVPSVTIADDSLKTSGPSPLRNILTFLLKRSLQKSAAFGELNNAVESFNKEARKENGFITEIENPINKALEDWNVLFKLSVQQISPDNIVKQLIQHTFQDVVLGDKEMPLDFFGQGFQRSLIAVVTSCVDSWPSCNMGLVYYATSSSATISS